MYSKITAKTQQKRSFFCSVLCSVSCAFGSKNTAKTQQKRSFSCTVSCASSCVCQKPKKSNKRAKTQQKLSKNAAFHVLLHVLFLVLLRAKTQQKRRFSCSDSCAFSKAKVKLFMYCFWLSCACREQIQSKQIHTGTSEGTSE